VVDVCGCGFLVRNNRFGCCGLPILCLVIVCCLRPPYSPPPPPPPPPPQGWRAGARGHGGDQVPEERPGEDHEAGGPGVHGPGRETGSDTQRLLTPLLPSSHSLSHPGQPRPVVGFVGSRTSKVLEWVSERLIRLNIATFIGTQGTLHWKKGFLYCHM